MSLYNYINDNKIILDRELKLLRKTDDNYEKLVLTFDKILLANEKGICIGMVIR